MLAKLRYYLAKALKFVLRMGLAPFGGRGGPPMIESVEVEEVATPAASDDDATPYERKRRGLEPDDVRNYLRAEPGNYLDAAAKLTLTTRRWADSLNMDERKAVLAASSDDLAAHLKGGEAIANVRTTASALGIDVPAKPFGRRGMEQEEGRELVRPRIPHGAEREAKTFGRRAFAPQPPAQANDIATAIAEAKERRQDTRRRRNRSAGNLPRPSPRMA